MSVPPLKPCPFCGGEAQEAWGYDERRTYLRIRCANHACQASSSKAAYKEAAQYQDARAKAAELWNRRTP